MLSHFVQAGRLRSRCNLATVAAIFCLLSTLAVTTPAFAVCTNGVLQQPTVPGEALLVNTACEVKAGTYLYGDVNIVAGGALSFDDATTEFWASSILIENKGSLTAGSVASPFGTNGGRLAIYLWGADQGKGGQGITCKSDAKNQCGVPDDIWTSTGQVTMCNGITDNFYPYMPLDYDNGGSTPGYFGYKVLGVSCGGTLQLFGLRGTMGVARQATSVTKCWASPAVERYNCSVCGERPIPIPAPTYYRRPIPVGAGRACSTMPEARRRTRMFW